MRCHSAASSFVPCCEEQTSPRHKFGACASSTPTTICRLPLLSSVVFAAASVAADDCSVKEVPVHGAPDVGEVMTVVFFIVCYRE
jgi:hypothetical protein